MTRQTNGKLTFERSGSELDLTAHVKEAFDQTTVAGGRFTVIKDGHLVEVVPMPEGKLRLGGDSVDGPASSLATKTVSTACSLESSWLLIPLLSMIAPTSF